MARFRLRFLLHEFDLPSDEVFIGRDASCELTVDDPLVSRKHARIFVQAGEAWIEDLGSRNGVRVDGRSISGPTVLRDGAHLRVGTQEMHLRRSAEKRRHPAGRVSTGFLVHCEHCDRPFGTDEPSCPHCGREEPSVSTCSELNSTDSASAWSMELLVAAMSRASSLGRSADTERLLIQAKDALESVGGHVERRRLDQFASAALELALKNDSPNWAEWALKIFVERGLLPNPQMSQRLSELPPSSRNSIVPQVDELLRATPPDGANDAIDLEALEALRSFVHSGAPSGPVTRDDREASSAPGKEGGGHGS